jgi:hypothetical protein
MGLFRRNIPSLFQGFEGYLSTKEVRKNRLQKVAAKDEFLFSLSSSTSDVSICVQQSAEMHEMSEYGGMSMGKRVRFYHALYVFITYALASFLLSVVNASDAVKKPLILAYTLFHSIV